MKNRSLSLLSLLAANDQLGQPLVHRTTLVKQVFLAETIRPLYLIWLRSFSFVRYFYGPYSDDVFQRLDTLIFSGLVSVASFEQRLGKREARYQITLAGHRLLQEFSPSVVTSLAKDLIWGLQSVGVDQANSICKLVYQEAEFARSFALQNNEGLGPEAKIPLPSILAANNETFIALTALQEFQNRPDSAEAPHALSTREIVRIFLLSLAMQVPRQGIYAEKRT